MRNETKFVIVRLIAVTGLLAGSLFSQPARGQTRAAADSAAGTDSTLLQRLQREDTEFFPPEVTTFDRVLVDSALNRLETGGLPAVKEHAEELAHMSSGFDVDLDLANHLLDYNRVEGLVAGLGATVGLPRWWQPELRLEGAYAVASEEFRHYSSLTAPLPFGFGTDAYAEAYYTDRVVPFGSNRPFANAFRTAVGAADERDYLRSRGGGVALHFDTNRLQTALAYEAARQTSVSADEEFSVFGRLPRRNPSIEPGIERALVARAALGSLGEDRYRAEVSHRVAGGALGGEFAYHRTDLSLSTRRFLGRQEFVIDGILTHTGGGTPFQAAADLGGLNSVRGFDRRTRVGASSVAGRVEYHVPYDLLARSRIPLLRDLHLQFVPWVDVGRVFDGDTDRWLTSAGLGIQYYIGPFGPASYIRFDIAFPTGPDRTDDIRFYLRFGQGLFGD